jgi:hypothetical protein
VEIQLAASDTATVRLGGSRVVLGVVLAFAQVAYADGPTCNEDRSVCCEWWISRVSSAKASPGAILETRVRQQIDADRAMNAKLCRYFGPDDSSCSVTYSEPACSGACQSSASFDDVVRGLENDLAQQSKITTPWGDLALGAERNPIEDAVAWLCKDALERTRYKQKEAAALLGLTYDQFRQRYRKYALGKE